MNASINGKTHAAGDSLVAGAGMPSGWLEAPGGLRAQMIAACPVIHPRMRLTKSSSQLTVSNAIAGVANSLTPTDPNIFSSNFTSHGIGGAVIADIKADFAGYIGNFAPDLLLLAMCVNETDPVTQLADYGFVLDEYHSNFPHGQVLCIGGLCLSEQWLTGPNRLSIETFFPYDDNILACCQARPIWTEYCPLADSVLNYEVVHNTPSPGVGSGLLTLDGRHPNSTGQPFMTAVMMTHINVTE